ncbi:MAG: ATP-binding cassette domain-containing protein [Candidatus Izemoplasmatales bacterium]
MLQIKNISKKYINEKSTNILALNNVSFSFLDEGLYFITGRSGSGKTTFLDIIGGLDLPTNGEVLYGKKKLNNISEEEWEEIRKKEIGYVFQENNLFENMEIYENIMLLEERKSEKELRKLKAILKDLGMEDIDPTRKANELSAGQKQRISIMRALVRSSKMILADEVTENLDIATARNIMTTLYNISKNKLVIVVTHDIDLAREFPSTLLVLEEGKIISVERVNGVIKSFTDLVVTKNNSKDSTKNIRAKQVYSFLQENTISHNDQFTLKIVEKDKDTNILDSKIVHVEMFEDSYRITSKSIFQFSRRFIKIFTLRGIVSSLLVLISLIFSLFIGMVMLHNEQQSVIDYIDKYEVNELRLYDRIQYTNLFEEEVTIRVETGKNLYSEIVSHCEQIYKVKENIAISLEPFENMGMMKSVRYAYYNDIDLSITGHYPQTENEILISDYLYQKLFGDSVYEIPKKIYDQNGEKTIVGIVLSGYQKTELYSEDIREYMLENLYSFVYSKDIPVSYANLVARDMDLKRELYFVDGVDSVSQGSSPSSVNEVVISSEIAETYSLEIGDRLYFPNVYDSNLSVRYSAEINYYDFFPEGIKIVGIKESTEKSLYLNMEDYSMIYDFYLKYYIYDYFVAEIQNHSEVSKVVNSNLFISDPVVESIYEIANQIDFIKSIIIPMSFLAALLILLSCYNAVSSIFHKMNKKIGVLRTLGISRKNTRLVFLFPTLIVFILCYLIAFQGYLFSMSYLNELFSKNIHANLVLFKVNIWLILLNLLVPLGLFIGILNLFIRNIYNKTIFSNIYK